MSIRLPLEINPLRSIEKRQILDGSIAVAQLSRLSELLTSSDGELIVHMDFIKNEEGLPTITGSINGQISLECQRCLEAIPHEVQSAFNVVLVKTDQQAEQHQDTYDTWMLEEERLFLSDFIEDEVLLSLPLITKHEVCETAKPLIEIQPEEIIALEQEGRENPFAVLKGLKP